MAFDYLGIKTNVVIPALQNFGSAVVVKRQVDTTAWVKKYDPIDGADYWENQTTLATTFTEPTGSTEETTGIAVLSAFKDNEIEGTIIQKNDRKLLAINIPEPDIMDVYEFGGREYKYVKHKSIVPDGENIVLQIIQVRI